MKCITLLSISVIKHWPKATWKRIVCFVLQITVYHPGEVTVGTQGRN